MKNYLKKITSVLLLWSYFLQITVAVAMPLPVNTTSNQPSSTYGTSNNSTDSAIPGWIGDSTMPAQNFNLSTDNLGLSGPLSVGVNYDSLMGTILGGQYAQKLTNNFALGALGEYGEDQYRLSGTAGFQVSEQGMVKVTAEYLSQVLPFSFDSGDIDQRVDQSAYGARFQQNINHSFVQDVNVGGYWANAPNTDLSTVTFVGDDGYNYINERNLAGATSQGLDVGIDFLVTPTTSMNAKVYYDDVKYDTEMTSDSTYDANGIGGSLKVNQLIGDRVQLSVDGELREIYNSYGAEIAYVPQSEKLAGMKIGLFAQRLLSQNQTPDSNTFGIQMSFLSDHKPAAIDYKSDHLQPALDIAQWVKTPAVYMQRVLVISEQSTYLAGPGITSIDPNNGPYIGGNTVTVTGNNFVPGTIILFGTLPGVVTFVSPTELSVVVPGDNSDILVVDVTVQNPDGQNSGIPDGYTYNTNTPPDPTFLSLSPNFGPTSGDTLVTLTGTNFIDVVTTTEEGGLQAAPPSVTFDGFEATSVVIINDTTIIARTPAHVAGPVDVMLTLPNKPDMSLPQSYTYIPPNPILTSLTPTSGPVIGGTPVVLSGTDFTGTTGVTFDGVPATSVVVINNTTITAVTPANPAGIVDVTILNPREDSTLPDAYTYIATAPFITALSPDSGTTLGGTFVTVTGTSLTGTTSLTFDGLEASNVSVVNDTTVTANTPAHAAGAVTVVITTPAGTGDNTYTYVTPTPVLTSLSPTSGPVTGGTAVIITGTSLTGTTGITFDGVPATAVTVVNDTTVTAVTPANPAGLVDVILTNPNGSGTLPDAYTYLALPPTATSLTPTSGTTLGGTTVVITGTSLVGTTGVTFGGLPATNVTVLDEQTVSVSTPAHTAGLVDVSITTPQGTGTLNNAYTYITPPPSNLSLTPTSGTINGGTLVTFTGTTLTGTTGITFGGAAATSVTVIDDTTVTAVTAAHAAGIVDVIVTTPNGTGTVTNGYTYTTPATSITSINPTSGPTVGGTTVTITGDGLVGTSVVAFDGVLATNIIVIDNTTVTAVTPAHIAGLVDVSITATGGATSLPSAYTYIAPVPTLTSLTPISGPTVGGTLVTITGTGLIGTTAVDFGGSAATSITVIDDTTVTVLTSAHVAGLVNVSITTSGGTGTLNNAYTYIAAPGLTTISPIFGPTTGGTVVTLTGTNLTGTTNVSFDGNNATGVTVINSTTVTAIAPAHAAGLVNVGVTTLGGTSTLTDAYTYIAPPAATSLTPTSGTTLGGTTVTISGTNLDGTTAVSFGGSAATVSSATATTVVVITGVHAAGLVDVVLTNPVGTSTLTNAYTYVAPPALISVNPTAGSTIGGNTATITGTNLTDTTSVSFDGNIATNITIINATTVTVTVPAHAAGVVDVSLTTNAGTNTLTSAYTYVVPPNLTFITPPFGTTLGGTSVTLNGTGLTGTTAVTFGGISATGIVVNSDTSVTVTSGAHSAGLVSATLTTPGGTSTLTNVFTYITPPQLTSLSPVAGTTLGGTTVTITGTNLDGTTDVTFNGSNATGVVVVNNTTVTAITPSHLAGAVDVGLTTSVGTSTLNNGYTYVTPPVLASISPPTGSTLGGTTVSLIGTGLTGLTGVTFGVVAGTSIVVNSDTSATVTTASHSAGLVNVTVTNAGGSSTLNSVYTYILPPVLTSMTPTTGSTIGGELVTLTGTNLTGTTSVSFDGSTGVGLVVVNDTTVTLTAPSHVAGTFNVTLTNPVGSSVLPNAYTFVTPPTLSFLSPPSGTTSGGTSVTLVGTDLTGTSGVTFGGTAATSIFVNSSTSVTVTTPAHSAGLVNVILTNVGGSATLTGDYTFILPPDLVSLSPNTGAIAGGDSVTLTGSNFAGTTSVTFGGTQSTNITIVNANTVIVETPSHVAGATNVVITNNVGSSTLTNGFTFS